jgi:inhibitor of the pro-sigma K processing machinery
MVYYSLCRIFIKSMNINNKKQVMIKRSERMEDYILIGIILVGVIIFLFSLFMHKFEVVINFILRILLGGLGIYSVNIFLQQQGIESCVGLGGVSLLIVGILGLPGFVLLYGINVYLYFIGNGIL